MAMKLKVTDCKGIPFRGKAGKPRRGKLRAQITTVRIDPDAEEALKHEFGSLGNALYYLYEATVEYRINHYLPLHKEMLAMKPGDFFNHDDLALLIDALNYRTKNMSDRRRAKPFQRLIDYIQDRVGQRKVELWLRDADRREELEFEERPKKKR